MEDSDRLSALRTELVNRLGRQRYDTWLGPDTGMRFSPDGLLVRCSSQFELQFLRRRIHAHLVESLRVVAGGNAEVRFLVEDAEPSTGTDCHPTQKNLFEDLAIQDPRQGSEKSQAAEPGAPLQNGSARRPSAKPKPHVTFENFLQGESNRFAVQTLQTVAARLGQFGPILLYGPAGTGKSHLLQALKLQLQTTNRRLRVVRQTAEQFMTSFLETLEKRASASFRQKYRQLDVLLLDDIQFLVGKKATLQELLSTLGCLLEQGKQVVFTCGITPAELNKQCPELVGKIAGGLSLPLELPDFELRRELVNHLVRQMHPAIASYVTPEMAVLIATKITGSVRQLQGAINRLVVASDSQRKPLSIDSARVLLSEYVRQITPVVKLGEIQRAVCEVFGVEPASLKSPRKTRSVVEPRMVAMWLACDLTRSALGEISEFFGRRSHSTVIAAQRKVEQMVSRGDTMAISGRNCTVEEAIQQVRLALYSA